MTTGASNGGRVVINGGEVADGTGGPLAAQDILLEGGRIAASGPRGAFGSADCEVVDATGLVVAPGFIDVHSHADNAPLLDAGDTSKILQGVTTEVTGNCGFSLAPADPAHADLLAGFTARLFPPLGWGWRSFAGFLRLTDSRGYVTNYAPLAGHGTLRLAVLGMDARRADAGETARMGRLLDEALDAGAFGMSSGLIYPPGVFSDTGELAELAGHLRRDGRVYATHMRSEGGALLASVDEATEIGAGAGCRVEVSHLKASGRQNWGRAAAGPQPSCPPACRRGSRKAATRRCSPDWTTRRPSAVPEPRSRTAAPAGRVRWPGQDTTGSWCPAPPRTATRAGRSRRSPKAWASSRSARWCTCSGRNGSACRWSSRR
jgi:N-acyl-D-aspartate/D-glutamate deacylase